MNELTGTIFLDPTFSIVSRNGTDLLGLTIFSHASLYNQKELAKSLELNEGELTETFIAAAYRRWGVHCPRYLIGDYSFVILDRDSRTLFLARDHFGGVPLYYFYLRNKQLSFSTEIEALFSQPNIPRERDELQIAHFLLGDLGEELSSERTCYEEIKRLKSAHSLTLKDNRLEEKLFWEPSAHKKEASSSFRDLLSSAVKRRLTPTGKVGVPLSGGLDSGSIFSLCYDLSDNREEGTAFSLFDEEKQAHWEIQGINAHKETRNAVYHSRVPSESSHAFEKLFSQLNDSRDLFTSINAAFSYALFDFMSERDVRIALGGADGDLITSGNPFALSDLLRRGHLIEFLKELPGYARHYQISPWKMALQFGLLPLLPLLYRLTFAIRKKLNRVYGLKQFSLLSQDLNDRVPLNESLSRFEEEKLHSLSAKDVQRNALLSPALQAFRERSWAQSNDFSISLRQPFLDPRLAEYCLSLENEEKFYRGVEKRVLRDALSGILPEEVRAQHSHGGGVAKHFQIQFLRTYQTNILGELDTHKKKLSEWVNNDYLCSTITQWKEGYPEEAAEVIIRAYSLLKWLDNS